MPDNPYMHALQIPGETNSAPSNGAANPCVERFLEHCHRRKYPAKSVIIYAGDTPDVLYYIVKGSVTVLMEDDDGHEIVLAYINHGYLWVGITEHMPPVLDAFVYSEEQRAGLDGASEGAQRRLGPLRRSAGGARRPRSDGVGAQ